MKNKTNKTAFKPGGGGAGQRRKKDLNSEFEDSLERKGREGGRRLYGLGTNYSALLNSALDIGSETWLRAKQYLGHRPLDNLLKAVGGQSPKNCKHKLTRPSRFLSLYPGSQSLVCGWCVLSSRCSGC